MYKSDIWFRTEKNNILDLDFLLYIRMLGLTTLKIHNTFPEMH